MTNRGQAFIEALLVMLVSASVVSLSLVAVYWISLRIFINHHFYESLVCHIHSSSYECRTSFEKQVRSLPLIKNVEVKYHTKETTKSLQIFGEIQIMSSYCQNCSFLHLKDSVYVPKTYR